MNCEVSGSPYLFCKLFFCRRWGCGKTNWCTQGYFTIHNLLFTIHYSFASKVWPKM